MAAPGSRRAAPGTSTPVRTRQALGPGMAVRSHFRGAGRFPRPRGVTGAFPEAARRTRVGKQRSGRGDAVTDADPRAMSARSAFNFGRVD